MPAKSRADLKKAEADRLQALVIDLLREEENKYCADCEAKQPRWASWNLGVFLCIRCAGIHRNLGVHLTKVKSVNLDSWTAEQVQSMRVMGNAKAKAVYEAELPDHFRRPQTDQALESFIRAKYEHRRYMLKDWSPPRVDVADLPPPPDKHRHGSERATKSGSSKVTIPLGAPDKVGNLPSPSAVRSEPSQPVNDPPMLLDFAAPAPPHQSGDELSKSSRVLCWDAGAVGDAVDPLEDMFGPIVSAIPPTGVPPSTVTMSGVDTSLASTSHNSDATKTTSANNLGDLASISLTPAPEPEKKSTMDILALFDSAPNLAMRAPLAGPQQQQQQHQQLPAQGGAANDANLMSVFGAAQMQMPPPQQVGGFYAQNIIPHSQPAYGQNAQFVNQLGAMPAVSTFMSRETAAVFAAASPFANPSMLTSCAPSQGAAAAVPNAPAPAAFNAFADLQSLQMQNMAKQSGASAPSQTSNNAAGTAVDASSNNKMGSFLADFSRMGMGVDSTTAAPQTNGSIWD